MSLRSLVVLPCFLILTMVFSAFALISSLVDSTGNSSHRVAVLWATLLLVISGVRVRSNSSEGIVDGQSYIFAANHQSAFDILVLLVKLPIQFRWLAKDSLFKVPLFGWAMKRTGYIPINRSQAKQAYQSLLLAASKVREGTSIVIFPEGTRQNKETLGAFKKGGFVLAIKSQKPIIPVSIIGSAKVLTKDGFWITPGEIRVVQGQPIPTEGLQNKDAEKLMQKVREAIEENLKH
ncbi:MAG: lysophospholipid acyltransferase family protein [Thermodesulfobacteriota bacterium]